MAWLKGKIVRLVGENPAIAAALVQQGATLADQGDCDVLVHVCAPPPAKMTHELDYAEWRTTLASGFDQRFHQAQDFAVLRRKLGKGGAIVYVGAPEQALGSDHAAAAGALANLTKTLGVEWARDGIRVNCIQSNAANATLGNLVAYLVSDYAAYVTGAVMGVGTDD